MEDFSKEQQDELNKSVADISDSGLSDVDKGRLMRRRKELSIELRKATNPEERERIHNLIYEVDSLLNGV